MKLQTQNIHACSLAREGAAAYSGERSGGSSHWEEWRGGSVLSGTRKATVVSRAENENSETIAKR